jgi:site-specific DNA recombinase
VQRERIEAWCGLYGARPGEVFVELDESGGRADRPLLLEAIERVELGLSDGIVVARLDRLGRSLTDALGHIERIHLAGGTFVSVQDQFDLSTDHGRLVLRMMLSFAEFERDRIRTNWDDARRKAISRGVHGGRYTPVGYRRRSDGRLRVDRKTGDHVRHAFAMRVEGAKLAEVGNYLRENRVGSGRGTMVWNPSAVQRVLESRVYLGEVRSGAYVCVDAHPPLVDVVTWRLAQHQPAVRAQPPRPGLASPASAHSPSTSPNSSPSACSWRTANRAMVAWSGRCWAAITRHATSSRQARSIRRDDRTPRDQQYNNNATIIDGS